MGSGEQGVWIQFSPEIEVAKRQPHVAQRTGIRIRGHRGHPEVRGALIRFARWLRKNYEFPIRVPVYLSPHKEIVTIDGNKAEVSFFAPYDRNVEPYIRIATGDYPAEKREQGRDNALASYICALAHQVIHYQEWVETGELWEKGVERKATAILRRYELTTDHP